MEYVRLSTVDNVKIQLDSIALYPRKCTSGALPVPEMILSSKEELQCFIYVGSNDGCVAQFACTITASDGDSLLTPTGAQQQHRVVATQTQKRKIFEGVETNVPFLYLDDRLREPRLLVMCGGRIAMLHFSSLEPLPVFQNVKALDGASVCCVAQGQQDARRLAAIVKKQIVLVEYSETSCSPYVQPGSGSTPSIVAPDGITQMAWHHNVIICGSKREYFLYDARTNHAIDQVVVDKMALGPAIRFLPEYLGGSTMLRLGDSIVRYDAKSRQPVDATARVEFPEPVVDVCFCYPYLIGIKSDGRVFVRSTIDDEDVLLATNSMLSFGTSVRSHATCPLIIAACTNLTLGCLVSIPPAVMVSKYVSMGAYERAIQHYEHCFGSTSCGADGTAAAMTSTEEAKYVAGLRRIRHSCAVHALVYARKYHVAFEFFELAETPSENIVRSIPALCRPHADDAASDSASTMGDACSTSLRVPTLAAFSDPTAYELLFAYLKRHRAPVYDASLVSEGQRDVDYALFTMLLTGLVPFVEDELKDLFLPASALEAEVCLPLVERQRSAFEAAEAAAVAAGQPGVGVTTASFVSLLLSADGRFAEALSQCRAQQLVTEAIVPLQLSGELSLFVEHLPWMLEANPSAAVKALTTNPTNRDPPSVDAMLPLVLPYSGVTLSAYLEHVIVSLRCQDASIHTVHALNLIETVAELRKFGLQSLPSHVDSLKIESGKEYGLVGETRSRLLQFLSWSTVYDADVVIGSLTNVGDLDEELVAAYRRCGEHDLALHILVYKLHDYDAAEDYCIDLHHRRGYRWKKQRRAVDVDSNASQCGGDLMTPTAAQIPNFSFASQSSGEESQPRGSSSFGAAHVQLPRALQRPTQSVAPVKGQNKFGRDESTPLGSTILSFDGDDAAAPQQRGVPDALASTYNEFFIVLLRVLLVPPKGQSPRVSHALRLLETYSEQINAVSVLSTLPGDVELCEISAYLIATMRNVAQRRYITQMAAQASASDCSAMQRERSLMTQRFVYIDDSRTCVVCKKKVGDAVFGVFPNLKVAHFRCFKDRDVDPERGTPFMADV